MVRSPCCSKIGLNRGSWTSSEDKILTDYIRLHGEGKWRHLPIKAVRCSATHISPHPQLLRPSVGEFKLDVAKATADAFLMYEEKSNNVSSLNVDVNMECLSDIFNMDNEVAKGDVMMSGSSTFTAGGGGDGSTQNDMLDTFSWMLGGDWLSSL
ncbi:hypothetical protein R6Q59_016547 [Mikania micrantha]